MTSDAPSVVGLMKDFNDIPQKDHQSLNAFINEMSTFFENSPDTMTGFLTHIYDCDPDYTKRTRIGEKESIAFPWFNWIGGTTPRWMGDNLGPNAVEGGLVARTLYIYSAELKYDEPEPEVTEKFIKSGATLTHDLAHILNVHGQFEWEGGREGDAFTFFREFYRDPDRVPRVPDNRTQGYYVRKHIHMQKVAMLLSLAESDDRLFRLRHLERAKALLELYVEPSMKKAFTAVGSNPFATDFERIGDQIEQSGGMSMKDIVNSNYHNLDQHKLEITIQSLVAAGRIVKDMTVQPPLYRPVVKV